MISRDEVLMGRDKEFPLSEELEANLTKLLSALNQFRAAYGKPMYVSSGYRPDYYNKIAMGSPNSAHKTCEACDFYDHTGELDAWCLANLDVLEKCGLYLESPDATEGWTHLMIRRPASGHRVFIP